MVEDKDVFVSNCEPLTVRDQLDDLYNYTVSLLERIKELEKWREVLDRERREKQGN